MRLLRMVASCALWIVAAVLAIPSLALILLVEFEFLGDIAEGLWEEE